MENNRIPFSQIIIDGLVTEAREKGYKGKDLDGYVSLAIKQRGERVMMEVADAASQDEPSLKAKPTE